MCSARRTRCSWRATRAAVLDSDRAAVEQILKDKGVVPSGAFLDQGRLTLRFSSKQDQLKARDLIAEARPGQFTIALSQASRVPEWMRNLGLSPAETRPGSPRRRVPGLSGRRSGRREAAPRPLRTGFSRVLAQCPRAVSGRSGGLPPVSRAGAVPRCRQQHPGARRPSSRTTAT